MEYHIKSVECYDGVTRLVTLSQEDIDSLYVLGRGQYDDAWLQEAGNEALSWLYENATADYRESDFSTHVQICIKYKKREYYPFFASYENDNKMKTPDTKKIFKRILTKKTGEPVLPNRIFVGDSVIIASSHPTFQTGNMDEWVPFLQRQAYNENTFVVI